MPHAAAEDDGWGHPLINMRGRIYDPELGRFTTPDPFVQAPFFSQSLNRYAYAFNNPLRYTDPSGFKGIEGKRAAFGEKSNEGDHWVDKGGVHHFRFPELCVTGCNDKPTGPATGAAPTTDTKAATADGEKDQRPPPGTETTGGPDTPIGPPLPPPPPSGPSDQLQHATMQAQIAAAHDSGGGSQGSNAGPSAAPQRGVQRRDRIAELGGPVGVMIESAKTVVAGALCGVFGCAQAGGTVGEEVESKTELEKMGGSALLVGGGAVVGKVVRGTGVLSRLGISKESAARLGRKAAEAEEQIGIHGVSTTEGSTSEAVSQAERAAVEEHFPVHDTPTNADPLHRTVELPKPVTKQIADLFNRLFAR